LQAALRQVTDSQCLLGKRDIKRLVAGMKSLPAVPTIYSQLIALLNDPEADAEAVGGLLSRDGSMTANILKLANSAFFGLRRKVTNVTDAVAFLGIDTIKSLVLSLKLFDQFPGDVAERLGLADLSRRSNLTAVVARDIARCERAPSAVAEECFLGGLLHDIGRLVLAANFTADYFEVQRLEHEEHCGISEAEKRVFGATHADVGGYLLGLWGLPANVVEAIAGHLDPAVSSARGFTALVAVHVADVLVAETESAADAPSLAIVNESWLHSLGLFDRMPLWRQSAHHILLSNQSDE
jgi:HD-like signal output (HDOD) protein